MQFAIDRYVVGTEKEVNAVEFDGVYIPNRRNRFFCPECGEIVFFRQKGGTHPSQFFHQGKTVETPECDRRVDGRSGLSLSQRVGLPVYITRSILDNKYQLCIGFPALDSDILDRTSKENLKICITDGIHNVTRSLNHTCFIESEPTLIPVDFVPDNEKNYKIRIIGKTEYIEFKRKLSDYADGFDKLGAIFTFDETGGKKIRRGDSISTNKTYYVVVKDNFPTLEYVKAVEQGFLRIGSELYKVLTIVIHVSVDDKYSFEKLNNFFKVNFGVWLLEFIPELVPIWPPAIHRNGTFHVDKQSNLMCAVSSGNTVPNVYVYSGSSVQKKEIDDLVNGVNIVNINVNESATILSVDRKYVGREISVISKSIPCSTYDYNIQFSDKEGEFISFQQLNSNLSASYCILSNAKMELIQVTSSNLCKHIALREKLTKVSLAGDCDELYFVVENAVIKHFDLKSVNNRNNSNENYSLLIASKERGVLVPIPRWCVYVLHRLRINHEYKVCELITSSFHNGKIHLELLKLLQQIYFQKKN